MPKICYTPKTFSVAHLKVIETANAILRDYAAQGYDLTLRQLYYQFVSRALIANKDTEYKRLGSIVNDARLAGLIDWNHITDRTRNMRQNPHWDSPKDIIKVCASQYQIDKWAAQGEYVEVWVEKDALVGVLEVACSPLDVPYFSCRGYTSQSEMWVAGQRLLGKIREGKKVTIIHLGDHDPSGIDMSRDIEDRIKLFVEHHLIRDYLKDCKRKHGESDDVYYKRAGDDFVKNGKAAYQNFTLNRIALTMEQIEEYNPPPNPAKLSDSRSSDYVKEYGDESWELDALEPRVLTELIETAVADLRDQEEWDALVEREEAEKLKLVKCYEKWGEVEKIL